MAEKIIKIDKKKLIKVLNEAYAEEWLAYYQYWIGAKIAKGVMRPDIEEEFNEHAGEELEHANKLADRIIQLGGTPILNPNQWDKVARCKYDEPKSEDAEELLKQNIKAERCAIQRYQEICEMCYGGKDIATFHMARSILDDELEHEQDLEDLADDIKVLVEKYGCDCNKTKKKK